jgi:hypothetical protein
MEASRPRDENSPNRRGPVRAPAAEIWLARGIIRFQPNGEKERARQREEDAREKYVIDKE